MPAISALCIYPVKSCAGIALDESRIVLRGLAHDRRYMLVDEHGAFVTQREEPRLALVKTRVDDDGRVFVRIGADEVAIEKPDDAPAFTVEIWSDRVKATELRGAATDLFTAYLGRHVRLVSMEEETHRQVDRRYAAKGDIVSFTDGFPVLVASEASLEELNRRLEERGARAVGMDRFRPNMVLSGTRPFEEDEHEGFRAGDITFRLVKKCSRCSIVSTDQETAEVGREPLATLAQFRTKQRRVYFAMNALVSGTGTIRVGDAIDWLD